MDRGKLLKLSGRSSGSPLIRNFSESRKFSDFLEAFDAAIHEQVDADSLLDEFERNKEAITGPLDWNVFQRLVAQLRFHVPTDRSATPTPPVAAVEPVKVEQDERIQSMTQEFVEAIAESAYRSNDLKEGLSARVQDSRDPLYPYYYFVPALELQAALEAEFEPEANPGMIIGRYMRAMLEPKTRTDIEPSKVATLDPSDSILAIVDAVLTWGQLQVPDLQTDSEAEAPFGVRHLIALSMAWNFLAGRDANWPPLPFRHDMESESARFCCVLLGTGEITQSLFESVLHHFIERLRANGNCGEFQPFVLLSQFAFGDCYRGSRQRDECTIAEVRELFPLGPYGTALNFLYIPWRFVPLLLRSSEELLFGWDSMTHRSGDDLEEYFGPSLVAISRKFRYARLQRCGESPLSLDENEYFLSVFDAHLDHHSWSTPKADLLLTLCRVLLDLGEGYPWGVSWVIHHSGVQDSLLTRAERYEALVNQAVDDQMFELASALLGFFVYSQTLAAEMIEGTEGGERVGLVADWPALAIALRTQLSSSRSQTLRESVRLSAARLERRGFVAGSMNLYGLVGRSSGEVLKLAPTPLVERPLYRTGTERQLIESVGSDVRERLPSAAYESLIDAQLLWNRNYDLLGNGLDDWGHVVIAFTKPIEIALTERLAPVYGSAEFATYRQASAKGAKSANTTLGTSLHMLRNFSRLPEVLRNSVEATGVRLHNSKDLLDELQGIQQLRNRAAHTGKVHSEDLIDLRRRLFDQGLLRRFALVI